jgi:hypothetical protein
MALPSSEPLERRSQGFPRILFLRAYMYGCVVYATMEGTRPASIVFCIISRKSPAKRIYMWFVIPASPSLQPAPSGFLTIGKVEVFFSSFWKRMHVVGKSWLTNTTLLYRILLLRASVPVLRMQLARLLVTYDLLLQIQTTASAMLLLPNGWVRTWNTKCPKGKFLTNITFFLYCWRRSWGWLFPYGGTVGSLHLHHQPSSSYLYHYHY